MAIFRFSMQSLLNVQEGTMSDNSVKKERDWSSLPIATSLLLLAGSKARKLVLIGHVRQFYISLLNLAAAKPPAKKLER